MKINFDFSNPLDITRELQLNDNEKKLQHNNFCNVALNIIHFIDIKDFHKEEALYSILKEEIRDDIKEVVDKQIINNKLIKFDNKTIYSIIVSLLLTQVFSNVKELKPSEPIKKIFQLFFQAVHPNNFRTFAHFQKIPWYLEEFCNVIKKYEDDFILTFQSCKGYSFYSLSDKNKVLIHKPFFLKSKLPENDSNDMSNFRGLFDTMVFLTNTMLEFSKQIRKKSDDISFTYKKRYDEVFLLFNENTIKEKKMNGLCRLIDKIEEMFNWFKIDLKCNKGSLNGKNIRSLNIDYEVSKSREIDINNKQFLISSINFRQSIESLSRIWLSNNIKSILLLAWTGSGKEVLFDFFKEAYLTNKEFIHKENLQFLATEENNEKIKEEILNVNEKDKKRALVFIDEIHHETSFNTRTKMLRILENDSIFPLKNTFFFCASESLDIIRTYPPKDFWTRIEYIVTLKHPFSTESNYERNNILTDYFLYFWKRNIHKFISTKTEETDKLNPNFSERLVRLKTLLKNEKHNDEKLKLDKKLADLFVNRINSPFVPIISIRTYRNLIKKLFDFFIFKIRFCNIQSEDCKCKINHLLSCKNNLYIDFEKEIKNQISSTIADFEFKGIF